MKKLPGSLFIITGESGAGKTTIVDLIVAAHKHMLRVITCTTRQPRANNGIMEINDVSYHFLSQEEFATKLASGEFAEHAPVYKNWYGTLTRDIEATRATAAIAIAVVDIQGAETLMRLYPEAHSIFIHVPKAQMEERLRARGDKDDAAITTRLAEYDTEWAKSSLCDEVVINANGKLKEATSTLVSILELRRSVDECMAATKASRKKVRKST